MLTFNDGFYAGLDAKPNAKSNAGSDVESDAEPNARPDAEPDVSRGGWIRDATSPVRPVLPIYGPIHHLVFRGTHDSFQIFYLVARRLVPLIFLPSTRILLCNMINGCWYRACCVYNTEPTEPIFLEFFLGCGVGWFGDLFLFV